MKGDNRHKYILRKLDKKDIADIKRKTAEAIVPYNGFVKEYYFADDRFRICSGFGAGFERDSFRTGLYVCFDNSDKEHTVVTVEYSPTYVRGIFMFVLTALMLAAIILMPQNSDVPKFYVIYGYIPIILFMLYGLYNIYIPLVEYKNKPYHDHQEMFEKLENILESYGIERNEDL